MLTRALLTHPCLSLAVISLSSTLQAIISLMPKFTMIMPNAISTVDVSERLQVPVWKVLVLQMAKATLPGLLIMPISRSFMAEVSTMLNLCMVTSIPLSVTAMWMFSAVVPSSVIWRLVAPSPLPPPTALLALISVQALAATPTAAMHRETTIIY